jgi:hypothetical protein
MTQTSVDLAGLFGNVAQVLVQNQSALNQADTNNNDHGDNMVKVFNTITQALEKKQKSPASSQLEYASQQVEKNCPSGSGKVYAEGLARAASSVKGHSITSDNAIQLISSLLGTSTSSQTQAQPKNGETDLGTLFGTLMGGAGGGQQSGSTSGDMMGSILGSLLGGGQSSSQSQSTSGGINMAQIFAAGMEYMNSKQQGQDTMSAILDAMVAGSQTGGGYRDQSSKLVAGTLMQSLASYLSKK